MPANIPPLKKRVPMPKHDTDGLEQYYDYDVRDDSEIKKELRHERNNKISTVAAYISLIFLALSIITAVVSEFFINEPLVIIAFASIGITFVSGLVCGGFDDDIHC